MEYRKPKGITDSGEITHHQRQYLHSLQQKKYRYLHRQFLIEGIKPVSEALEASFPITNIFVSKSLSDNISWLREIDRQIVSLVSDRTIKSIGTLQHPEGIIAIANMPEDKNFNLFLTAPFIYLWEINDPGNLGTIFRTARWFGIRTVLLSPNSVDPFSPKVVRSSMGALFHINVFQNIGVAELIKQCSDLSIDLYAAIPGASPLRRSIDAVWGLILGSESHGLPEQITNAPVIPIGIPLYGSGESLNVSVSAGILINELVKTKRG